MCRCLFGRLLACLFACVVILPASPALAEGGRMLFSFESSSASSTWRTVNDGVMGGRSVGRARINQDENLEFYGNLSLANNGGFASVRARGYQMSLKSGDTIVLRVKGDGRVYNLNLYTPNFRTAFSYRARFRTLKDKWGTVRIPLSDFRATSFGRTVGGQPRPDQVNGIGILLGDKNPGSFKLEVDWIKVESAASTNSSEAKQDG